MSVWLAIPSIRPNGGTIPLWREKGYKIAVVRQGDPIRDEIEDIEIPVDHYLGWARSINILCALILSEDPDAEWIVSGGDDTEPSERDPQEIGQECRNWFARDAFMGGATFGVMQPTGDKKHWPGSAIDKFAGSPWMGREFCRRINGGKGPMREEFHHMYGDEALQCIAEKYGCFWQRTDLTHSHQHYLRPGKSFTGIPDFMREPNSPQHWAHSSRIFNELKAAGWPGSEPIA